MTQPGARQREAPEQRERKSRPTGVQIAGLEEEGRADGEVRGCGKEESKGGELIELCWNGLRRDVETSGRVLM